VTEDKSKTDTTKTKTQHRKKQTTQNTAQQNYPSSVTFYDIQPGNEVGLFYNAPEPTRGEFRVLLDLLTTRISYTCVFTIFKDMLLPY